MAKRVFIDGAAGTTGLEIRERLASRGELTVLSLDDRARKDVRARRSALNEADLVILCLPDEAARESVSLIDNPDVRVIDASTAHRVADGWTFGFPELELGQAAAIARAKRVSNPGCWSTGFLALVRPLLRAGLIPADAALSAHGISGYSGGGKAMIAEFEKPDSPAFVETVARSYALGLGHKHVPEMTMWSGLKQPPVFSPSVGRFYRGMIVEVPLHLWAVPAKPKAADLRAAYRNAYAGKPLIEVAAAEESASLKTLDAESLKNTDRLKIHVFANDELGQARLTAVFDNLGKGAAGAAVQNLNLMLGLPETAGLI